MYDLLRHFILISKKAKTATISCGNFRWNQNGASFRFFQHNLLYTMSNNSIKLIQKKTPRLTYSSESAIGNRYFKSFDMFIFIVYGCVYECQTF